MNRFLIILIALWSTGALAGDVFSAAPQLKTVPDTVFLQMNWVGSNGVLMEAPDPDEPPIRRDNFDEIVLSWPDMFTGINLEPVANTGWKFLDGLVYPKEATKVFEDIAERIIELRPGFDFCFYTMPQSTNWLTKDPKGYGVAMMERELAFLDVTQHMKTVCISGYWKDGTFERWSRRMDMAIAFGSAVHNKRVVPFLWDNRGSSYTPRGTEGMRSMLNYFKARGLDVIYWDYWSEGKQKEIHWQTKMALWEFTQ